MNEQGQLDILEFEVDRTKKVTVTNFVHSVEILWKVVSDSIKDTNEKQKVYSPILNVSTGHPVDAKYRILLKTEDEDVFISVVADKDQLKVMKHRLSFKFSIRGEGDRVDPIKYSTGVNDYESGWGWSMKLPINRTQLLELMDKYKVLLVKGTITGYSGDSQDFAHYQQRQKMATLFDKQLGDFTIRAESKNIKAYKWMLEMGSPVFAKLFRNKLKMAKVKLTGRRLEKELSYKTTYDMLKYLYTADFTLHMNAADLLVAADKYQIDTLKELCIKRLLATEVTVDNACQFFYLGVVCEVESLAQKAGLYIRHHKDAAMKTVGWKKYLAGPKNAKVLETLFPII